jgi:hypothetical protein
MALLISSEAESIHDNAFNSSWLGCVPRDMLSSYLALLVFAVPDCFHGW